MLRTARSSRRVRPTRTVSESASSCGKPPRAAASAVRSSVARRLPSLSRVTAAIDHGRIRAKPWSGASGAPAFGPNQGKQIGTPPRIGLPASKRLCELIQRTGFSPFGWKWAT